MNQKLTVLYARTRKFRQTFSKFIPDIGDAIRDYISFTLGSTLLQEKSGGGRNQTYYYLAPDLNLFVEVVDKMSGFTVYNCNNHLDRINIYNENDEYIRGIANAINALWSDVGGILEHVIWNKIENKFKVKKEDYIGTWKSFLD